MLDISLKTAEPRAGSSSHISAPISAPPRVPSQTALPNHDVTRAQERAGGHPIPGRINPRPPENRGAALDLAVDSTPKLSNLVGAHVQPHFQPQSPARKNSPKPVWDQARRELRIGSLVVKRFKWPAENQEAVLDAFEEEGWPDQIDDPITQHPGICAKQRLHDAIKCLNRKQVNSVIKFRGDGTGCGVRLEINLH